MFVNIIAQPDVATAISLFVTFSFVIAFIVAYKNCRNNPSVFIIGAVLFVDFVLANNALYNFLAETVITDPESFYLRWVQYDALAIICTIVCHLIFRVRHERVTMVIMYLLMFNAGMCIAMHLDIIVNGNREPWWLWTLYTPCVHLIELTIAVSLIWVSIRDIRLQRKESGQLIK